MHAIIRVYPVPDGNLVCVPVNDCNTNPNPNADTNDMRTGFCDGYLVPVADTGM